MPLTVTALDAVLFVVRLARQGSWRQRVKVPVSFAVAKAAFLVAFVVSLAPLSSLPDLYLPATPMGREPSYLASVPSLVACAVMLAALYRWQWRSTEPDAGRR